jgi:hypothetical protein
MDGYSIDLELVIARACEVMSLVEIAGVHKSVVLLLFDTCLLDTLQGQVAPLRKVRRF